MQPFPDSERGSEADVLMERVDALATWIHEIDSRVRAAEVATGDEKTAKELRKAVEAVAKHDPKFQERLTNQVDVLADRVATLAGTVSTTTAALAGKDGEIAGLRRELAQASGRMAELQTEVQSGTTASGEIDDLRRTVARLSSERGSRVEDKKLAGLEEKLALLAQRLDTVSATVSTAAASIAGRDGDVASLRRRLDEDGARIVGAITELRQAVDPALALELRAALDAVSQRATTVQQETRRDLVGFGVDLEAVKQQLARFESAAADAAAGSDAEIAALRARMKEGGTRIVFLEQSLESTSGRLEELDRQLDRLGRTIDAAASKAEPDEELAALSARFESRCAQVDSLVRDLREALDTMPGPSADPALRERVETLAHEVDSLTAEIARSPGADETEQLRVLVDGLRMRVATGEKELAALAGSHDVVALLDDLDRRVEAVETRGVEPTSSLGPIAGDGRYRVELRALELRMEHAEAAARESREAVLTQLERLAARIEARLQRLESEQASHSSPETVMDGQVVPIRSSEA
ncbi:MAG TPA: hypothetical protein VK926_07140 [Gaiellaceae bacterium]|nr:hypothetical protein [Gaiellaceae bacterium]